MRKAVARWSGVAMLAVWVAITAADLASMFQSARHLALLAVIVAIFAMFLAVRAPGALLARAILFPRRAIFVGGCALVAAAVSLALARVAMNGQVIALDSSVYVMEARALSHLSFGAPIPEPRLPFGARFLFEGPDARLYGVFPPGYPLFLVPFVLIGHPLLAGPVTALLLVLAHYVLARAVTRDETALRLSLLLALPSFARALETADLLSHAFVAALAALAIGTALRLRAHPTAARAALVGGAVGWTFAARMLDGLVLAAVVVAILVVAALARRVPPRLLAIVALAAMPFVALVAAQQKAATGSFTTPTQSEYFVRSDWPPTCHRLGFGRDVGCTVEHPGDRGMHGPDGYGLDDAFRVVRERTVGLGQDLFGFGPLLLLAFLVVIRRPSPAYATIAAFPVLLTLAYGLFYYGNAPGFGARHVFPAAPFLYVLVARGLTSAPRFRLFGYERERVRAGAMAFALTLVCLAQADRWRRTIREVRAHQAFRGNVRDRIAQAGITHGIVATPDTYGYIAALDPVKDAPARHLVVDDRAGLDELRRANPTLPMFFAGPLSIERRELPPPAPGLHLEMESAWPSFQRVERLGARRIDSMREVGFPSSGGEALAIFVSEPGAVLTVPFDVVVGGRMTIRMDGIATPNSGDYELAIDGVPIAPWRGWALRSEPRRGEPSEPRDLAKGRHVFTARCLGKLAASRGYLAAFDALIGEPASLPTSRRSKRSLTARRAFDRSAPSTCAGAASIRSSRDQAPSES